ncbi:hypothetical protein HGM15179_016872 [Zosterops borbonicus]|uniref:Uncharacterized protein n=1 Tax=Zosterops borbonicus TaxID=364589 RepID=A0A8K1G1U3_9PASS|nr:hypothetical protein HGM15179_016872 [Zosterops borbonicus]
MRIRISRYGNRVMRNQNYYSCDARAHIELDLPEIFGKGPGVTGQGEWFKLTGGIWDIEKEFLPVRVVRGWNGIPRESVAVPIPGSVQGNILPEKFDGAPTPVNCRRATDIMHMDLCKAFLPGADNILISDLEGCGADSWNINCGVENGRDGLTHRAEVNSSIVCEENRDEW